MNGGFSKANSEWFIEANLKNLADCPQQTKTNERKSMSARMGDFLHPATTLHLQLVEALFSSF